MGVDGMLVFVPPFSSHVNQNSLKEVDLWDAADIWRPYRSEAFLSLVVIVVELSPYSLGQAAVKVGPMMELNWSFCVTFWNQQMNIEK